ncbi:hypothetical protein, partial [Massilia agri]
MLSSSCVSVRWVDEDSIAPRMHACAGCATNCMIRGANGASGNKKGSSRISGKRGFNLQEE